MTVGTAQAGDPFDERQRSTPRLRRDSRLEETMRSGATLKWTTAMLALAAGIAMTGEALAQERYPSRPI